jgi:hypothetical protein
MVHQLKPFKGDEVLLYDTKGSDRDGIATVVLYIEK